jgi:ABC-type branched-subunit amino acid transport system substrate-binding protein
MNTGMRGAAALAGLVLLLAGISACGGGDNEEDEGPQARFDLVIGDLVPLSGDLAELGPAGQKAADLAVDRINSAIRETGAAQSVQIVHGDNGSDPAVAAQAAQKMVDADGASCLVGAWSAEDSLEVAESVSIPEGVLQISPAPGNEEVSKLNDEELVNGVATGVASYGAESADFDELYESAKPSEVDLAPFASQAFDATILCYLAAVAAGSAEGKEMALKLIDNTAPRGTEFSWEQLPDAAEALEAGEDIDYEGASGPIDMDENGDASASTTPSLSG